MRMNSIYLKSFLLAVCCVIIVFGRNSLTAKAYSEGEDTYYYDTYGIGASEGYKYTADAEWVPTGLKKTVIQGENLSDDKSIVYLIMADGFTESEQEKFNSEAKAMMNYLMKLCPYSEFKDLTKVYTVFTPSEQSGASRDMSYEKYIDAYEVAKETGGNVEKIKLKKTFFNCSFNQLSMYGNYERLLEPSCAGMQRAADVAAEYVPDYNQIIIISNSERYGGSGLSEQWPGYSPYIPEGAEGTYFKSVDSINLAVASINAASKEVAAHEIAHALGNLADEYWPGEVFAAESPNMTKTNDAKTIAWKAFLTYSERTNIGIYPFTGYGYDDDIAASWFRPSNGNCKMEALSYPNRGIFYEFCEVCREGFRENMSKASNSTTIYWQDYCKNSTPATANVIAADGSLDYDTPDHTGYKTEFAYTGSAPEDLEKSFIVRHAGEIISNPAITFTYYDSKGNKLDKAPSASGTYTVTASYKGDGINTNDCKVTKAYTILEAPGNQAPESPALSAPKSMTLSHTSYTYNGKAKRPSVTIKDTDGKKISSSNYTVSYSSGCKNVGRYTVKVTFKEDYSQFKSMSKTFDINPKGTSISSLKAAKKGFTVKWKKQTKQITGYQIQYSTSKNFKSNVKTKTFNKSAKLKKVTKLSAKRTYYVRIRTYKTVKIGGKDKKMYSGWSTAKKVKTNK